MRQQTRTAGQDLLRDLHLSLPPATKERYQQLESTEASSSVDASLLGDIQRFNTCLEQLVALIQQDNALGHLFDQRLQRYDVDALRRHRRQFYREMFISSIVSALLGWLISSLASPMTLFSNLLR